MNIEGVWLPIITPFLHDKVDEESYGKLIEHYINKGITGIIANGTTGESPVLSENELELLVNKTVELVNHRVPVYIGLGGNYTNEVVHALKMVENAKADGILSVSPYYNRPDQRGIYEHFKKISESTSLPVILYNIPYRTGRNMENDTILKLAELKNIVGIKDSCGIAGQTIELLALKPQDFSVFTGEDVLFLTNLAHGGAGGILASAHLQTEKFLSIFSFMKNNNYQAAQKEWLPLIQTIQLLFKEPNPTPLKFILKEQNLIASDEVRLPLVGISDALKKEIRMAMQGLS